MSSSAEYDVDFRVRPEAYRYQSGEQGVFKIQPYKDELLPHWGVEDEETAEEAVAALREKYDVYREREDFADSDVARKDLQMGFTRAMRYATYLDGKKYEEDGIKRPSQQCADPEKRAAAVVFQNAWQQVTSDPAYQRLKERHREEVCDPEASPMADQG